MTNFNIKNVGLTNSYQTAEFDPAGWKELGRTTLTSSTPTFEDDFSSNSGWVYTGTVSYNASGYQNLNFARNGSNNCLLYTSPSPRDGLLSRMPSSA